ncbi:MAG: signal peptide peptidase SppA [Bdellovibrionales bacterium]|nr:signal peptide peptidase SppA [Bdellovibrionales bacterium]
MKDFFKTIIASAIGTMVGVVFLTFLGMILLVSVVAGLIASESYKDVAGIVEDKSIIVIHVEGGLTERRLPTDVIQDMIYQEKSKDIGMYELEKALNSAASDAKIAGVYLRLRWVDAGWAKIESFRNLLLKFKESGKFIYAYSEAYDEKLYYIATAATEILMYPKGEFEWDGIYSQSMFFKKTLEKLDVEPNLIRAGKFKSAGEMITKEKMSEENRLQITEIYSTIWGHVTSQIAKSNPEITQEQLNDFAETLKVTTAAQAYNLKLVTLLAPIEEVEQKLLKATGLPEDEEPRTVNWLSYYEKNIKSKSQDEHIAVIMADGEIYSGRGSETQAIYSDEFSLLIRDLARDEDVKAIVLRVNSPGGSALASDVIWRSLEYFKKKGKTLVTSFSDVAASGGYYIAAGSDYIYAEPTTITGSIGVFGLLFNTQKFFDGKLGITFDEVKTHSSSDMLSGSRNLTAYEQQRIQSDVNTTYKTFLNVVKQGRKKFADENEVGEVAEGRVWVGQKALEIGLVDEMGSLNQAILKAAELAKLKDYDVVVYPDQKKFLDRFLESFGEAWMPPFVKQMWSWAHKNKESNIYARLLFNLG